MIISRNYNNSTPYDFCPSNVANPIINTFLSHQLGMFFSFAMPTYTNTDAYGTNMLSDPPMASTFSASSTIDSALWVDTAINSGADYVVLTLNNQFGFNIYPYESSWTSGNTYDSTRGLLSTPKYATYNISANASSDQQIVEKFVNRCNQVGIKFGLYYNIGLDINKRRGINLIDGSYDTTNTFSLTYNIWVNYIKNELVYLINTYNPDYMWLDSPHRTPRYLNAGIRTGKRLQQEFYNAIKFINPSCLVVVNYAPVLDSVTPNGSDVDNPPFSWDGTEMIVFPTDIVSFEYSRKPSGAAEYVSATSHYGKSYYLPREIISTIFSSGQYFACNDNFPAMKSAATLQAEYDFAKGKSIPYLLSIAINTSGNIPSDQLTRFQTIVK